MQERLAADFGVGAMAANPDETIPAGTESNRLAIVDLDWDRVRAVDIFAVLNSFLKRGQAIKSVTIYPSDFGQEVRAGEYVFGQPAGPQAIENMLQKCDIGLQDDIEICAVPFL